MANYEETMYLIRKHEELLEQEQEKANKAFPGEIELEYRHSIDKEIERVQTAKRKLRRLVEGY